MANETPTTIDNSTILMHLESGEYPIRFWELRRRITNVAFSETPDVSFINELGYVVVEPTTKPEGIVAEGAPVLEAGVWKQTWVVRTLEGQELEDYMTQKKQELLNQLNDTVRSDLATGYPYLFPDGNVYHVQQRSEDRTNITGARIKADVFIAQGQGTSSTFFIPFENIAVVVDQQFIHDLADESYTQFMGYLERKNTLRAQINGAKTPAELPTVPATLGWTE